MKNVINLLVGFSLITLLAVTLPSQIEQKPAENYNDTLQPESLPSQVLKEQTVAWYQYFDLKPITKELVVHQKNTLAIIPEEKQAQKEFIVFRLYNLTNQNQAFATQNGSLIMIQEAKNQDGNWQPIEYWDYDWGLGSDFGQLVLAPKHSVLFTVPLFEGDFETSLRLKLKIDTSSTSEILYSEEFKAKVNIGQFNKPEKAKESISYLK